MVLLQKEYLCRVLTVRQSLLPAPRAADHARDIPDRHPYGLISIILRIAECSDAFELVLRTVAEAGDGDI